jgi:hypothetical protein
VRVACAQAAPPSVVIDVGDCVDLKSPGERLDCYERHVEAAKQNARATPAATPQPDAVVNAPTPQPSAVANAPTPPPAALAATAVAGTAAVAAPNAAAPQAAPAAPTPAAPAPPVASAASTSASASSTDTLGFSKPPTHDAQLPPEIVAIVTELHETVPNAWQITLDNGQVWRQNIPQRFALKPGHHVTLRGTTWGTAYRLTADELHGFIQVERVR